ncbi:hypothetical protein [Microbacterium hominis]|uniref:hypothetical protein n=1 Tax=Microbacterium hominis TaxID=162426 RepID=UPI001CC2972E|nr:hypothetical protein [Microbacterium hominis]
MNETDATTPADGIQSPSSAPIEKTASTGAPAAIGRADARRTNGSPAASVRKTAPS